MYFVSSAWTASVPPDMRLLVNARAKSPESKWPVWRATRKSFRSLAP
jgi:hypothetical protein